MITIRSLPRRLVVWERGESRLPFSDFPVPVRGAVPTASRFRWGLSSEQRVTGQICKDYFNGMEESETWTLEQEKPSGLISVEEAAMQAWS
jgi:hypothetical protein